ncbi:MAG: hypothetical protein PF961_17915, partial [Planctomycetota bacterium]|nr:hypothetical protein [Planctomycetota bacterium]
MRRLLCLGCLALALLGCGERDPVALRINSGEVLESFGTLAMVTSARISTTPRPLQPAEHEHVVSALMSAAAGVGLSQSEQEPGLLVVLYR